MAAQARVVDHLLQPLVIWAAAHEQKGRLWHPAVDLRQRTNEGVLPLTGDEPGDADDHWPMCQAEPVTDLGTAGPGPKFAFVHSWRELNHVGRGSRRERAGDPAARVLTEVGDDVHPGSDPAQQ